MGTSETYGTVTRQRYPHLFSIMAQSISQIDPSPGDLEGSPDKLPDSTSPSLHLSHPTNDETLQIWNITSNDWRDALTVPQYLEEYAYLLTAPLARNNGITQWVLVDENQPIDRRKVLASCETFFKRALTTDPDGVCRQVIAHGVASVYCEPGLRKRGYASRLLNELAKTLPSWQTDDGIRCVASVLYSDIDPRFYQRLGWNPFPSYHLEFDSDEVAHDATPLSAPHLAALCEADEAILRSSMSKSSDGKPQFAIVPDHDHIVWHHSKEEFGAQKLFGKTPLVKGAIAGPSGNRVWAIWAHRFYRHPDSNSSVNTLYILRFVTEGETPAVEHVRAVLQAARAEAAQWRLGTVKLWSPSKELERLIESGGITFQRRTRIQESIPCLQWYGEGNVLPGTLNWVLNEKYAWC
ncbi:GNAT family N-acetyltransferase [Aspergillus lucknowensis]|uniref:N-acetyltransferase domain-containing protein n=1 Tax=Aspergillus lucknowensis TaxID=176173 RepID=A0ABR4LPI8_9EURO